MFWNSLHEKINIFLYDHKKHVFTVLNYVTPIALLIGISILVVTFGFSPSQNFSVWLSKFLVYAVNLLLVAFVLRLVFGLQSGHYIMEHVFESFIYFVLAVNSLFYLLLGQPLLLLANFIMPDGYAMVIRLVLILIFFIEIGRVSSNFKRVRLNPATLLALSFVILIITGTVILRMPEMTNGHHILWIDALFTSTSACCVTGLAVHDTGLFFSFKGQFVIMLLLLVGGLNMLTIATFIGSLYHQTGSLHIAGVIRGFLDTDQNSNLQSILRNVVLYAFVIQFVGATVIYFSWSHETVFVDWNERLFYSVFHAISAFNNAGFSLFTNGLNHELVRYQYLLHLEIALLIVVGGLGFLVLQDVFAIKNRQNRKIHPWKKLQVNTRLVFLMTTILIATGMVLFFVLEYDNTLKDLSLTGKIVTSIFQSVTTRTAGFNTVDLSLLGRPTIMLFLALMFIGASPGSTGGGIKTTTLAVAFKAAWANMRGREHVELFKRNISWGYVNKTYAVLFSAFSYIVLFAFLLVIVEPKFSLKELFFELVSAFGTVGLSLGITPDLSFTGKLILIVSMFVGRIGFLTLGLALTRKVMYTKYKYPTGKLMIG
jgi:potassium uptake TrkH family protein